MRLSVLWCVFYGILFLYPVAGSTQPYVDILNTKYKYFPPANYHKEDAQLAVQEVKVDLFVPVPLESGDVLIAGSTFNRQYLQYQGDTNHTQPLTSIDLQLGINKKWDETWKTLFIVIPKVSSDFREINRDHWQLGGVGLVTYTHAEDLKFKFGLYYNREFFGHFFMPLGGIDWDVTERLNIFGVLPGNMNIEYRLNEHFYTGIGYQAITGSFRSSRGAEPLYIREGHTFWSHNQLWGFFDAYPHENVVVYAEAGHTLWRSFDLYNEQDQRLQTFPWYRSFQDQFFFTVGAAYRIRLEEQENSE